MKKPTIFTSSLTTFSNNKQTSSVSTNRTNVTLFFQLNLTNLKVWFCRKRNGKTELKVKLIRANCLFQRLHNRCCFASAAYFYLGSSLPPFPICRRAFLSCIFLQLFFSGTICFVRFSKNSFVFKFAAGNDS